MERNTKFNICHHQYSFVVERLKWTRSEEKMNQIPFKSNHSRGCMRVCGLCSCICVCASWSGRQSLEMRSNWQRKEAREKEGERQWTSIANDASRRRKQGKKCFSSLFAVKPNTLVYPHRPTCKTYLLEEHLRVHLTEKKQLIQVNRKCAHPVSSSNLFIQCIIKNIVQITAGWCQASSHRLERPRKFDLRVESSIDDTWWLDTKCTHTLLKNVDHNIRQRDDGIWTCLQTSEYKKRQR